MRRLPQHRLVPALMLGGLSCWAWSEVGGPLVIGGQINLLPALATGGMALSALTLGGAMLQITANLCQRRKVLIPTGAKGTAKLLRSTSTLKHEMVPKDEPAIYMGMVDGKPVRPWLEACAFIVGPSGSGKSTRLYLQIILSLLGASCVIFDFKSDVTPQVARPIRQSGTDLIILNLGRLFEELVGPSASYNPLCVVTDAFWRRGGLEDVPDIVRSLCFQLEPQREGEKNDDSFWQNSNRRWGGIAIQVLVIIKGENATLGDVLQLLNDRRDLLRHMQWACGRLEVERVDDAGNPVTELARMPIEDSLWASVHNPEDLANYAAFVRALASSVCDMLETADSRTAESILAGAQEMLSGFEITSRAHKITSRTTFRFADLKEDKDRPVSVSFMLDPDKTESQAKVLGVINWALQWEIRRHPNKAKPVYALADEISNIPWSRLDSVVTWSRAYTFIFIFLFQSFASFARAHSEATMQTLHSEAEIKLIMPQTRNSRALELIEKIIGQGSVVLEHYRSNPQLGAFGTELADFREEARPVLNSDELRRTKKGILIIRDNPALLVDLPSIAEIEPWRREIDPSPFYGKPYLKPVKVYLNGRIRGRWKRLMAALGKLLKGDGAR